MNYSLEKISTVKACDAVLAWAQKKKQTLERRRRNLGESMGNFNERLDQLGSEQASMLSLLEAFITVYDALPEDSMDKINMNVEVKRLEVREAQLRRIALTCNVHSLLAKQVSYNRLDIQVSAIESYIITVQNKRTALNNAALHINHAEQDLLKKQTSNQIRPQIETGRLPMRGSAFRASRLYTKNSALKKVCTVLKFHLPALPAVRQKQRPEKRWYKSQMPFSRSNQVKL
jgi:hypothetical protein